jgi:hypothetical protein
MIREDILKPWKKNLFRRRTPALTAVSVNVAAKLGAASADHSTALHQKRQKRKRNTSRSSENSDFSLKGHL